MDPSYREQLSRQGNCFVGEHTAVQVCGWTKKALRDEGACYKGAFYGIKSHRCVQMSPAMNFCDHDCVFCWRTRNNSGFGTVDDPRSMAKHCVDAQRVLLSGFGGFDRTNKEKFKQAQDPLHFAISLNGEPTYYPRLNEFVKDLKEKGMSSFIVTNGQQPEVLRKLEPPTQLYVSLDAPNEELYKKIDRPMRDDGWQRLLETLRVLKEIKEKTRTVIRVTVINEMNNINPEEWGELIALADPHFVEVKGYMFVGASRNRLTMRNMPFHEQVKAFAEAIGEQCGYVVVSEHEKSRAVLLMKESEKDAPWRYIDFVPENKVWKRGESEDLPPVDRRSKGRKDELTVEQAEQLVKIR